MVWAMSEPFATAPGGHQGSCHTVPASLRRGLYNRGHTVARRN
jgi:hypothetical protein